MGFFSSFLGSIKDVLTGNAFNELVKKIEDLISNNSSYEQQESNYYNSIAYTSTPENIKKVLDKNNALTGRRFQPLGYDEYIKYDHRDYTNPNTLRIGDIQFCIPPEFISVTQKNSHSALGTLRQKGSINTTNGYSNLDISMVIYFNGIDQINGYKVQSPTGYYYVDGIRSLLAQFMVQPFVPIVNEYLNIEHNIYNVALNNIMVSTVEGFPNVFEVTLAMSEVTLQPYIETPDVFFHDIIDWDLFRFNYQRLLQKNNKLNTYLPPIENINSSIKFSQIKHEVLNGTIDVNNIYDDSNFNCIIDSNNDELIVENISFNMSNIIPNIQMSANNKPTSQYLGCSDINFSITMTCTDKGVINKFTSMDSYIASLAKQYHEFGTFGFMKIDNELLNMTGNKFFIIDNIITSTVPGFPGVYKITITCTSFDSRQKSREDLVGITPFNTSKGTKDDAITQDINGILNKIVQDNIVEGKISKMELYPDLHLPLYKELDDFITKLREFRNRNNLMQVSYTKYPKPYSVTVGNGLNGQYCLYADPDFYVFYPLKYSSMDNEVFNDKNFKGCSNITPVSTVGRNIEWGDAPDAPEGFTYNSDGKLVRNNSSSDTTTTSSSGTVTYSGDVAKDFATLCTKIANEHHPYVWGADGPNEFDCSGLICWALREIGVAPKGYRKNNDGVFNDYFTPISFEQLQAGDICNRAGEHIACYIGNGQTAEAKGKQYGCVIDKANKIRFNQFGRLKSTYAGNRYKKNESTTTENVNDKNKAFTGYNSVENLSRFCRNAIQGKAKVFQECGAKWNLNPALVLCIVNHETGYATSKAIRNYNNPGGIMDWNNNWSTLKRFSSLDEGIEYVFKNLYEGYIKQGLVTIEQIQQKYCPIGASNDPNGDNIHWLPTVKSMYKDITGSNDVQCVLDPNMNVNTIGDGSVSNITPYTFHKCKNGGITFGNRKEELPISNLGKPVYKTSPIMALSVKDNVATVKQNTANKLLTGKEKILSGIVGKTGETISYMVNNIPGLEESISFIMEGAGIISDFWIIDGIVDKVSDIINFSSGIIFGFDNKYSELVSSFYSDEKDVVNSMFTDMFMYDLKDKFNRAFPSYLLLLQDDGGDWLDGRKLWSNYYMYKSVISINVHQESSQPVHTATVEVTNVHNNLKRKLKASQILKKIEEDKEYNSFVRWIYKNTGCLLGTPKLTNDMVEVKNQIYNTINIKPGLKIHIRIGYGSNPLMYPICFNGTVTDMEINNTISMVAQSYGLELINNVIETDPQGINKINNLGSEPSGVISDIMTSRNNWFLNTVNKKWGESSKYGIENFGISRGHEMSEIVQEYDILKNVFLSQYECKPFCNKSIWDNEKNANYYLYNKTPYDIFQNLTQTMPEFICQPHYHQFDCRLFFGLPYWLNKYRYDFDNGTICETAKTYSQFHYIDSMCEIINSSINTNSNDVYTNCVAMYTLAENTKSAPTVYSDRTIYQNYQKTKVIDTTLTQDYIGWDWLYEKTVAPVAKRAAIKMSISNLLDSWNKSYDGNILIIGNGSIKPYDYLMINDEFAYIKGLCNVRQVVHSISCQSGFTTNITPGMLGINAMKNSGAGNIYKSLISFGTAYGAVRTARNTSIKIAENYNSLISLQRLVTRLKYEDSVAYTAFTSIPNYFVGKIILNVIGTGKLITAFSEVSKTIIGTTANILAFINNITVVNKVTSMIKITSFGKKVKNIKNCLTFLGTTVCPGIGTIATWVIGTVAFDIILGSVIDEFSYNNSIKLFPLTYKNEPLIINCYGQTNLIAGITENSDTDSQGIKIPDPQTDKENEQNNRLV